MIWDELVTQITTAMQGTNPLVNLPAVNPLPIIGEDWPAEKGLKAVAGGTLPDGATSIISIFDRGAEKNITQAINLFYALPPVDNAPGAAITLSGTLLPPGQTVTLTGSGTPIQNDAFCLTLMSGPSDSTQIFAKYIVPNNTTTLSAALTAFTAQINTLSGISAALVGSAITVTNNNQGIYDVRSEVVNTGYFTQEPYRWLREVQVTLWTRSFADRNLYGNVLEQLFTQLELNYGFLTSDQSACRVTVKDDLVQKDTQLTDLYRRDFLICIDYPVLYQAPAYDIETIPQTYASPIPEN